MIGAWICWSPTQGALLVRRPVLTNRSAHRRPEHPGWTMSTLVHVPDDRFDAALDAIATRLVDGAPLAVGLWGGRDYQGPSERDTIQPPRFFSLRSHQRVQRMLVRVGRVERFETWDRVTSTGWQYQWAVVRISHPSGEPAG